MPSFFTSIQHCTGSFSQAISQGKKKKQPKWKGRSKTVSLFADEKTLHIENSKEFSQKKTVKGNTQIQSARI